MIALELQQLLFILAMHQIAVDLGAQGHFQQVVKHIAIYLGFRRQFNTFGGIDIAYYLAI